MKSCQDTLKGEINVNIRQLRIKEQHDYRYEECQK